MPSLWQRVLYNPLDRRVQHLHGVPILPGRHPFVGHMLAARYALPDLLRRAERTLGPTFWLEFPTPEGKVLDLVHLDEEAFNLLRSRSVDSSLLRSGAVELLGDSMMVHDGAPHRHARSAFNARFTPRGLTSSGVGALLARTIDARVAKLVRPGALRVIEETQELTLEVIFKLLDQPPGDLPAWRKACQELSMIVVKLPVEFPGSPSSRGRRARDWLSGRILEAIERARSAPPDASFLAGVVDALDDDGQRLDGAELVENLRLLLFAGHETSATAMAWMLIELGRDRALFRRLVEEALSVGTVPDSPGAAKQFPLAEALFRESVRLHTPIPLISRVLVEDTEIGGRCFPKGTRVTLPLAHFSRDARRYPPDPEGFRPDRWLERAAPPGPFETLPFGGGPHFCLGYHVAWMESVQLAVALALHAHRRGLRPLHDGPVPRSTWFPIAAPVAATTVRFVVD